MTKNCRDCQDTICMLNGMDRVPVHDGCFIRPFESTLLTQDDIDKRANEYPCLDFDFPEDGGKVELRILLERQERKTKTAFLKILNTHVVQQSSMFIVTMTKFHVITRWLEGLTS